MPYHMRHFAVFLQSSADKKHKRNEKYDINIYIPNPSSEEADFVTNLQLVI